MRMAVKQTNVLVENMEPGIHGVIVRMPDSDDYAPRRECDDNARGWKPLEQLDETQND